MTGADLRLYRRMRGIFWGLLVVGVFTIPVLLALAFAVGSALEWYSASTIADVGTAESVIEGTFGMAGVIGLLAAVVLGATAGSVDLQRGVLRDLVLAGKARWRIVVGRMLGAYAWLLLAMLVTCAVAIAIALTIPPDTTVGSWERVAREGLQYLPGILYVVPFAAGIAMLVGSRGPAVVVFFLVAFLVDGILGAVPTVGEWWAHVSLSLADQQVTAAVLDQPGPAGPNGDRSIWAAVAVLAGWALVPFGAGIARLTTRDL